MMERVTGVDNLSKFTLDAMNKVVYHADNIVTTLLVSKSGARILSVTAVQP
jgi:Holliday junction resolvase RusA-like endonuclease